MEKEDQRTAPLDPIVTQTCLAPILERGKVGLIRDSFSKFRTALRVHQGGWRLTFSTAPAPCPATQQTF
eukprot:2690708-Ditylum_brightwellii.AAC.1